MIAGIQRYMIFMLISFWVLTLAIFWVNWVKCDSCTQIGLSFFFFGFTMGDEQKGERKRPTKKKFGLILRYLSIFSLILSR